MLTFCPRQTICPRSRFRGRSPKLLFEDAVEDPGQSAKA